MDVIAQVILSSLGLGMLYGAVGVGFVIVHRMTGMVNFAQGEIAVVGAFGAVVASAVLPPLLAILAGAVTAAIASAIMYWLAIYPIRRQALLVQTIVTLGVGILMRSIIQLVFGTGPQQFDPITAGPALSVLGGRITQQAVWLVAISVAAYILLTWFFDRTLTGKALSACAVNPYAAGIVGINLSVMATIAFAVSGAISGGVLAAQVPISFIAVGGGLILGLKGFIAAILGGFDRIGLTFVGGVLVALVEVSVARFISAGFSGIVLFLLLIVLLIVRPQGLTRMVVTDRV